MSNIRVGLATLTSPGLISKEDIGTWTPVPTYATGTAASITVTSATYTRLGRQVTVLMDLSFRVGTGSGIFSITGLPFTVNNNFGMSVSYLNNVTFPASSIVTGLFTSGTTSMNFYYKITDGTATAMQTATATQFASSGSDMRIIITGTYFV